MGVICVSISDEAEAEIRRLSVEKYGYKRGCLGKAVDEAIRLLLEKKRGEIAPSIVEVK